MSRTFFFTGGAGYVRSRCSKAFAQAGTAAEWATG